MAQEQPKRAFNKVSFEEVVYTRNVDMLEHLVLLAVTKSFRFYTSIKTRLCPVLPDNRSFRPDFSRADFNYIYNFVAQFWETLSRAGVVKDMGISPDLIDLIFAKKVEQNLIQPEDANHILSWLKEDLRTIDVEDDIMRTLPENPMFCKWLEQRAVEYEQRRISQSLGRPATIDDLQQAARNAQKSAQPSVNRIVEVKNILFSEIDYKAPIPTRMPRLNMLLGGGFWHQEALVVGAISGGGKTILAMQWALDGIMNNHKTVVVTTEQAPHQLIYRLLANHLNLDFGKFTERLSVNEREKMPTISGVRLPYLPAICVSSGYWDALNDLALKCQDNLLFIDWTGSNKSFEHDFDMEIEDLQIKHPDFNPELVIADWVGGGVQLESSDGNNLRHYYRAAGESIVKHMKRSNRAGVMFAQLNKSLVRPMQNFVTMDMLAECKSIVDKASGFLGVTAMRDSGRGDESENPQRLRTFQFLCADKSRYGPGGKVKVSVEFQYQRFGIPAPHLHSGGGRS
jgi:hypothetical protein